MSMPSGMELLLIFGIIILLFGAKKIPDLAKGIGKGIKNFKAEMKDDAPETAASEEAPKKVESGEEVASKEAPKTTTQA
ncbi:MAG: twin-arginine translocase TatA/TatE family subunit [Sulfurimonas sp.]|jgi:sec-independent protein translocase protein TatA|nr:twin-arginine translocase TatA/TatE family subunit [Sulfurimonas sp.]MBU1218081.1 twin-arginine translocase TatA/TatE family subunit [bacterium]MBU1434756.1 twin-arginine translocase TatA/TatE family subunit [bacterium]MBU1502744.1 twin-arginine translocase TatA/TatE family subunit [bacterium]MBU3940134.1 twin-arginine translocase TatA/TatE family subunit [bacterium]